MSDPHEQLVMAKELTDLFARQGVQIHYAYARAIIVECPASVRKRYIRFSDAWTWWCLHPNFQPFAEMPKAQQDLCRSGGNS